LRLLWALSYMVSVNRLTANPPGSGATARHALVESVL
jgi:hypothetical protein